jgi:hypothetical protein
MRFMPAASEEFNLLGGGRFLMGEPRLLHADKAQRKKATTYNAV